MFNSLLTSKIQVDMLYEHLLGFLTGGSSQAVVFNEVYRCEGYICKTKMCSTNSLGYQKEHGALLGSTQGKACSNSMRHTDRYI